MGRKMPNLRKFIVTGGAGFIGSHVVDLLASGGHRVMVLDNFSTGRRENLLPERENVSVMECDIRRDGEVMAAFLVDRDIDAVIHLAAQAAITTAQQNPYTDLSINGMGTLTLLKMCEKFKVKRFIYASTSAVYGDRLLGMSEETPIRPENYYGVSKATGELYTRIADLRATILRFGNVYGPRQVPIGENQVIARMMRHLFQGEEFYIFGDGKQCRDFIYVEDVARAVMMAIDGPMGIYNIAGGRSYSINQISKLVASTCGVDGYRWDYDYKRRDERKNALMYIHKAEDKLGWKPGVEIALGIRETMEWWRKQ